MVALLGLVNVRAGLPLYDSFDYPYGNELGEVSSAEIWENSKTELTIGKGSLNYPGLASPKGNRVNFEATAPNLDGVRTVAGAWPEQSSGTLYISFLLQLKSAASISSTDEGTALLTIGHTSNNSQLLSLNLLKDGAVRLGVLKQPSEGSVVSSSAFFAEGAGANLSADGSTTYLIVAKYEWLEGAGNDRVTLWVNPTALGAAEDAIHKVSTSTGPDGDKSAGRLTLCRGANVQIDELRIGQTWAEVTPPGGPSRQLWLMSALALGLVGAGLWITRLRRNVRERSLALQAQIQENQKAEQRRLMEHERARIAQDLHDELGADIAEISMLAVRVQGSDGADDEGRHCLSQLVGKSRQMVATLEEIVWAMNPEHDSVGDLVSYLSFWADRLLSLADIQLVVESGENASSLVLEARLRHQLFLVFKEALTNVVRHSGATEVRLTVRVENQVLRVEVADNGCGAQPLDSASGAHEGIANMRRRLEKLGGQFEIAVASAKGTTVKVTVPLKS